MPIPLNQWVDIGERPREEKPLMWTTYPMSPLTVGEAHDLAAEDKLILMHRHEPNRVVAQIWVRETPQSLYGRK